MGISNQFGRALLIELLRFRHGAASPSPTPQDGWMLLVFSLSGLTVMKKLAVLGVLASCAVHGAASRDAIDQFTCSNETSDHTILAMNNLLTIVIQHQLQSISGPTRKVGIAVDTVSPHFAAWTMTIRWSPQSLMKPSACERKRLRHSMSTTTF